MNPPVTLQYYKAKWSKGQKGWISRHILLSKCKHTEKFTALSLSTFEVHHTGIQIFISDTNLSQEKLTTLSLLKKVIRTDRWYFHSWWLLVLTLQGCGSTPYVSRVWAFLKKFSSEVSGLWPLLERDFNEILTYSKFNSNCLFQETKFRNSDCLSNRYSSIWLTSSGLSYISSVLWISAMRRSRRSECLGKNWNLEL